jgi:predicted RecB family endonuclease
MIKTSEKAAVYEILGNLSQHFEQVLLNLQRLRHLRVVESRDLKNLIVFVEEARAWAVFEIVSVLQLQEESDWAEFNRLRMLSERSFRKRGVSKRDPESRTRPVKKDSLE